MCEEKEEEEEGEKKPNVDDVHIRALMCHEAACGLCPSANDNIICK